MSHTERTTNMKTPFERVDIVALAALVPETQHSSQATIPFSKALYAWYARFALVVRAEMAQVLLSSRRAKRGYRTVGELSIRGHAVQSKRPRY